VSEELIQATIPGLSSTQIRAADLLSQGTSERLVLDKCKVQIQTLRKWYEDVRFQAAVDLFSSGAVAEVATSRSVAEILEEAAPKAAEQVERLMNEAEKDDTKLRAAEAVLDRTGHARQTEVRKTIVNIDVDGIALIEETRRMIEAAKIPEGESEVVDASET